MATIMRHGYTLGGPSQRRGWGRSGGTSTSGSGTSGGTSTRGLINPSALQDKLAADYEQARLAKQKRYEAGVGLFKQAADLYKPGGAFEQAAMQQYETGKRAALSGGMQNLISSGLAKGSNLGAMERGYEAEVGTPFRTQVAAEGQGRLAQAYQNLAGYMSGFQDIHPTAGTLAHLATGGFGALGGLAAQSAAQTASNYQASGGSLWGQDFLGGGNKRRGRQTTGGGGTAGGGIGGMTGGGQSGRSSISSPFSSNPYRTGGGGGGGTTPIRFDPAFLGAPEFSVGQGGGTYAPTAPPVSNLQTREQVPLSELTDEQLNPSPPASKPDLPLTKTGIGFKGYTIGSGDATYNWTGTHYRLKQRK